MQNVLKCKITKDSKGLANKHLRLQLKNNFLCKIKG